MSGRRDLPAGDFSSWLRRMATALLEDSGIEVPCGECTACCRSSYFVHIGAKEEETLARIPEKLLFAAPGLPKGNMVLGYDESGRCPMLHAEACSIYGQRPLTCRTYDCRVFAAAGIAADRVEITRRARRWAFSYPTEQDREQHSAVRAAARFAQGHPECIPDGAAADDPAQVAILAIKVHEVFLDHGDTGDRAGRASRVRDAETTAAVVKASNEFEARRESPRVRPGQLFRITGLSTS